MAGGVIYSAFFRCLHLHSDRGSIPTLIQQEVKQVCKTNRIFLLILVTEFENWLNLRYTPLSHQVLQTEKKMVL